ncbi:hypothetical protein MBLNU459_g6424t1 [Dothideomycetes sp. NU459]
MFGLGGFITFTSIMRFFALKAARSHDATYNMNSGFWSVIEINVGVICISLPPLRAFLSRYIPFLNRSPGSSKGYSSGNRPKITGPHQAGGWKSDSNNTNDDIHYELERDGTITKRTEIVITDRGRGSGRESDEIELRPFGMR